MKTIGFGIAGLGRIGKIHFKNVETFCENAKVVALSNLNVNNIEWIKSKQKGINIYERFDQMVNDKHVDAVIISSPTPFHSEQIKIALHAGKAIFCEKPIDLSLEKVIQVQELVNKSRIPFMVGYNRRYDPNILKIKKDIECGVIGTIQILKITSRDPSPPDIDYMKNSGGLFLDMSIHDFDMACYLNQQNVKKVYSTGSVFVDKEIKEIGDIDTAVTTITFENGSLATIDNSRKANYGYDQRVEVFGSLGMSISQNQLSNNNIIANNKGIHYSKPLGFFLERYSQSYISILNEFINCLINKKEISCGIKAGLDSLKIALAAKKSLNENRVVNFDEIN